MNRKSLKVQSVAPLDFYLFSNAVVIIDMTEETKGGLTVSFTPFSQFLRLLT